MSTTGAAFALHAEQVDHDPRAVRWVSMATLPGTGRLVSCPGSLGELLDQGWFTDALAERHRLWLWLRDDLSWSGVGQQVRRGLVGALRARDQWGFEDATEDLIRVVLRDVLAGETGAYIRSHGGNIEPTRISADGSVELELSGACSDCPSRGITLHDRVESVLRERLTNLGEISWHSASRASSPQQLLRLLPTRRR